MNAAEILSLEQQVHEAQEQHEEQMKGLQKEFAMDVIEGKEFYRGRLVVPDEEELKRQILQQYHDHPLAGHPGIANTILAVAREFWWPEVRKFATGNICGCATCQSTKPGTTKPKPPLLPILADEHQNPFQTISVDLITNLPSSNGFDSILTIVDHRCSKAAIFLPCQKCYVFTPFLHLDNPLSSPCYPLSLMDLSLLTCYLSLWPVTVMVYCLPHFFTHLSCAYVSFSFLLPS
jgi:hypothetical protein